MAYGYRKCWPAHLPRSCNVNSADLNLQRRIRRRDAGSDDPTTGEELSAQDERVGQAKQCEAVDLVVNEKTVVGCT